MTTKTRLEKISTCWGKLAPHISKLSVKDIEYIIDLELDRESPRRDILRRLVARHSRLTLQNNWNNILNTLKKNKKALKK